MRGPETMEELGKFIFEWGDSEGTDDCQVFEELSLKKRLGLAAGPLRVRGNLYKLENGRY